MNYYSFHIGDYLSATAHLSLIEHGAYRRLLDVYYIHEAPLPDIKQVYRLVGARTKNEKEAVDTVLKEFFLKTDVGFSHVRCDYEIEKFAKGQPEREARQANEAARVKRHREERAELFNKLREIGVHVAWNESIETLRTIVAEQSNNVSCNALPVTAPVTPATASPSPNHPITPSPKQNNLSEQTTSTTIPVVPAEPQPSPSPLSGEQEARAKVLADRLVKWEKAKGRIVRGVARHPVITRWVTSGLRDPDFRIAYERAEEARFKAEDQSAINPGFLDLFVQKAMAESDLPPPITAPPKAPDSCCVCGGLATHKTGADWYCSLHDKYSERKVNGTDLQIMSALDRKLSGVRPDLLEAHAASSGQGV